MKNFQYIRSFDGIRAFAVVIVLFLHGSYGFVKGGWIGVDLFFILSGYLITSLLKNEYLITGKIDFKKFYMRRALRLFPPLILCLVICNILWTYITSNANEDRVMANLASLFYFSNVLSYDAMGPLTHLWSLSVEEHFYFLWPILLTGFIFTISFRNKVIFLLIIILLSALFRIYIFNLPVPIKIGIFVIDSYRFTLCRLDSLCLGAALSIIYNDSWRIKNKLNSNLLLLVAFLMFMFILFSFSHTDGIIAGGGFVFTNTLCLYTVFIAVLFPNQTLLSNTVARWLGRRSYGIYIYHYPIFLALEGFRQQHNLINLIFITFLRILFTIIVTELSFRFVEQPILKLKIKYQAL